jgi:hypothetical protein
MKSMTEFFNENLKLRLVRRLDKTYIFDELSTEDEIYDLIQKPNVFNR